MRTRRYHALLLTTTEHGRVVLVNGIEAWIRFDSKTYPLSTQRYSPNVIHPDGWRSVVSVTMEPWPCWQYELSNGSQLRQEVFVPHGTDTVAVSWRITSGPSDAVLSVRPLLSGRDYHALMHENSAFKFESESIEEHVNWTTSPNMPSVCVHSNAQYRDEPEWYRNFEYVVEQERGLDHIEDLGSPGVFEWNLGETPAVWMASARPDLGDDGKTKTSALETYDALAQTELARRVTFANPQERAADAYIVRNNGRMTIIAGYPWFTDWGRDTFIAMRGLCLATERFSDAREILLAWSHWISKGMLPNRFPDRGMVPEYNSVDASLWYVIAVSEFLDLAASHQVDVSLDDRRQLDEAIDAILDGYSKGTRFGIRADLDGLLMAGEPGVQLTWMDAKVDDWVVTPRIGKPVEVQALWLNALAIGSDSSPRWAALYRRGLASFRDRFWNEGSGCLYDVIDVDHVPDRCDNSVRPNQIFAAGGLPVSLLERQQARSVVDVVERQLLTPLGLRSLSADDPQYHPLYQGGVYERDSTYHQGTVWPWLIGPFVEAWLRTRGQTRQAKETARQRFVEPLLAHLQEAGLGHVSEIADGQKPHVPRGCPFQAWSLGELLRLQRLVLAEPRES